MLGTVLTAFFFASAFAAKPGEPLTTFTALASDQGKYLYAALKKEAKGRGTTSMLVQIDAKTLKASSVPLPPEMVQREIRAVLARAGEVFALTQWTTGEGDNPSLYAYNVASRKWSPVGSVPCPGFEGFHSEQHQLVFKCEDTTKSLDVGKYELPVVAELVMPQTQASTTNLTATLDGQAPDWDKLQIKSGNKQTTLRPAQLLKAK